MEWQFIDYFHRRDIGKVYGLYKAVNPSHELPTIYICSEQYPKETGGYYRASEALIQKGL